MQAPRLFAPRIVALSSLAVLAICAAGCHPAALLDTKPLDDVGMSYDAIQQLKALQITPAELPGIAHARAAGLSDAGCVEAVRIYRSRGVPFDGGDSIASLLQAGMSEESVLDLARMGQLGLGVGEFQAMRLAGLSDAIVLEVARRRAAGQPVLSGGSLADMRNAGLREATMLELLRRGVPDSQADIILSARHHGATDAQILRHFSGS